jgi:hypothetical protein
MIYSTLIGTLALSTLAVGELHCTDDCLRSERPGDRPLMSTNGAMARKRDYWTHMKMVRQPTLPLSLFVNFLHRIIKLVKQPHRTALNVSMVVLENILALVLI